MTESITIIAFDQHAQSVVAAVLGPHDSEPALHPLASDLPTIGRFITQVRTRGPVRCCYEAGPCGLLSGFSVVQTESTSLKFPKITADIAAAWAAEASTLSPTDATIAQVTATPRKLTALSQISNELLRDSEQSVIDLLGRSLTRSLALKADLGFFEGSGAGAEITGLKNVAGIGAVSMGTNGLIPVNLDPFADAIGALATANATASAIVMHPRSWSTLTKVKEVSGSTKPVLQESSGSGSQGLRRSIYGVPVFLYEPAKRNGNSG